MGNEKLPKFSGRHKKRIIAYRLLRFSASCCGKPLALSNSTPTSQSESVSGGDPSELFDAHCDKKQSQRRDEEDNNRAIRCETPRFQIDLNPALPAGSSRNAGKKRPQPTTA
jgi:hypothetical protein